MGIAYDDAERVKEESVGDAPEVVVEAWLTSTLGKIATPAKSSDAAMGNTSSGHSVVSSQRWTAAVACALASGAWGPSGDQR